MGILGIETLHPGVYVVEKSGQPRIIGVGVNTAGFVGAAGKGRTDKAVFCSSFQNFVTEFGGAYRGSPLYHAVRYFFKEGGTRCYIARVVGAGAEKSWGNIQNLGREAANAIVMSGNSAPFDLEHDQYLEISIDGAAADTVIFDADPAIVTGSSFDGTGLDALTLEVSVDNGPVQTLTITGLADPATASEVALLLNNLVDGAKFDDIGGNVRFTSDSKGSSASVEIAGGTALGKLGFTTGTTYGTGNVQFIDSVTAQEVADLINAEITTGVASATVTGRVEVRSNSVGSPASIQVLGSSTATGIGFDNLIHNGSSSSFQNAFMALANSEGAWGDQVGISTTTWAGTLGFPLNNGEQSVRVASLRNVKKGDIVHVFDPTNTANMCINIVYDVDIATKTLELAFPVSGLTAQIPAGSTIASSSEHKMNTLTATGLSNGDEEVLVRDASSLRIGDLVTIMDGTTLLEVKVSGIDGNRIKFAPVALSATIPAGALAVSQEFGMAVFENGLFTESFNQLSMEEDSPSYIMAQLNGVSNRSNLIELTDLYATPSFDWMKIPRPISRQLLAGGADGATPTDDDYIGSDTDPKSGMYLFDQVLELNFFAIPGITTIPVQIAADAYAQKNSEIMFVMDCPEWTDRPQEVYDYRMFSLNINSSYSALYYPWLEVRDPDSNTNMFIPPSGSVCGKYSQVASQEGVHVAPANVLLTDVIDVQYRCSDSDQDLLNPVGVNVIRWFPGDGIRIYGSRTLWNIADGRHYVNVRRLLNYVKTSLRTGNRWVIQQPNDPRLWAMVTQVNSEFMRSLWLRGMLFPSDNLSQAFFVKCDRELNPDSERRAGRLNMEVGLNPPLPVEFFVIGVGLWYGGSEVTEAIGRGI